MMRNKSLAKTRMIKGMITAAALLGTISMSMPVFATEETEQYAVSDTFDMSTDYPGIYLKAGETSSFSLDFLNTTNESCNATLSVSEIPENWEGYFKGKSGEVSKVHVASSPEVKEDLATFNLTVPKDAAEGTYQIVLEADADNNKSDTLTLELTVSETENGVSEFTAEYPEQEAAAGTTFKFETTLVNNRGTAQSYSLSSKTDAGWSVTFTPSGESASVASVNLESGESKAITVAITPPETMTEGSYTVPISAVSSDDSLSTELTVSISGKYAVDVSTPSGNLSFDAYANDAKDVTLSIRNTGNVDLENLNLTSSAPTDWEVSFDESTIDVLEAGATKEVTAHVTPASDAMTGDYVTNITASNSAVTATAQFRVSVKTRTSWGIIAAGIIVILIAGLGVVFKKYGRR